MRMVWSLYNRAAVSSAVCMMKKRCLQLEDSSKQLLFPSMLGFGLVSRIKSNKHPVVHIT